MANAALESPGDTCPQHHTEGMRNIIKLRLSRVRHLQDQPFLPPWQAVESPGTCGDSPRIPEALFAHCHLGSSLPLKGSSGKPQTCHRTPSQGFQAECKEASVCQSRLRDPDKVCGFCSLENSPGAGLQSIPVFLILRLPS